MPPDHAVDIDLPIDELHYGDAPDVDEVPGKRSRAVTERRDAFEGEGTILFSGELPIALAEGRGATVRDVDGNTFIDLISGISVLNVGHSNPSVVPRVQEQVGKLVHSLDFPTEQRIEFFETLHGIAPAAFRDACRISVGGPTGSDAIEASIKLAKLNTGGSDLLAFRGSYHGGTTGALALTAKNALKREVSPLGPDVHFLPHPCTYRDRGVPMDEAVDRSLLELRSVLEDPDGGVANPAGVWLEPIQGNTMTLPPRDFFDGVRDATAEHGVPLVLDEVQTGFGRTGEWFAHEHVGADPDMLPLAKAIGGIGFPLAALLYREDLDDWAGDTPHISTFRGHVPAMVAGVRAIEYIEHHDLLDHARELGSLLLARLGDAAADTALLERVTGEGLFIGLHFVDRDGNPSREIRERVQRRCLERGVLLSSSGANRNLLRVLPPLVITEDLAAIACDVLVESIEAVEETTRE